MAKKYDVVIRCESEESARRQVEWLDYYLIDAEIVEREEDKTECQTTTPKPS